MSRIRSKDTKPEKIVRRLLHRMGYRYRLGTRIKISTTDARSRTIKPDIVLPKHKTAIFVHGCFWHRHPGCEFAYTPKSRIQFWQRKFNENVARDRRNEEILRRAGWNVVTVWECHTKNPDELARRVDESIRRFVHYRFENVTVPLIAAEPH